MPATTTASPSRSAIVRARCGCGRILIIDDEPMVAAALRRVLAPAHTVNAVTGASVALGRMAPEQVPRVVFMTGGVFTPAARVFLDQVPNVRIEKPFDVRNLRLAVHGVLAEQVVTRPGEGARSDTAPPRHDKRQ